MKYSKGEARSWVKENISGIIDAMTTPFTSDLEIDELALRNNIHHCLQLDINGVYVCGTVGEFWALSDNERKRILNITVDEVGDRAIVVAHTGHSSFKSALELTKHAEEAGADIAVIVLPYVQGRSNNGLVQFYKKIAEQVDIGICLYNTPFSGFVLSPEIIAKLVLEIPNICAVKTAFGDFRHTAKVRHLVGEEVIVSGIYLDYWLNGERCQFGGVAGHFYQNDKLKPVKEFVDLMMNGNDAMASKLYNQTISPLDRIFERYITTPMRKGVYDIPYFKSWEEFMGMQGGLVRPPLNNIKIEERNSFQKNLRTTFNKVGLL